MLYLCKISTLVAIWIAFLLVRYNALLRGDQRNTKAAAYHLNH